MGAGHVSPWGRSCDHQTGSAAADAILVRGWCNIGLGPAPSWFGTGAILFQGSAILIWGPEEPNWQHLGHPGAGHMGGAGRVMCRSQGGSRVADLEVLRWRHLGSGA